MVFSSSESIEDVIKRLRSIDPAKVVVKKIREAFLARDFNLQDTFCDVEDLRDSWKQFCIPDELITFFGTLFNINYVILKPNFPKAYNLEDDGDAEQMFSNDIDDNLKMNKLIETISKLKYYL